MIILISAAVYNYIGPIHAIYARKSFIGKTLRISIFKNAEKTIRSLLPITFSK